MGQLLENNESPSRKVGELDNRGSHFHLACHWAAALAEQDEDQDLKAFAKRFSEKLEARKDQILEELTVIQGNAADIGGYYHAPADKVCAVMQPSETLNSILAEFAEAAE